MSDVTWPQRVSRLLTGSRRRLGAAGGAQPAARQTAPPYAHQLLDEFHRYVAATFGARALSRDAFVEMFWRHYESGITRPANRFVGDLWYMFAPDFPDRFDEYYRSQQLQLTMTFLGYAASERILTENYLVPYSMMWERMPRARVLEVGAGLPHGFLSRVFDEGGGWCEELTIVELDAVYARFVAWFCGEHDIRFRHVPARAGVAPNIPREAPYGFVFAKDVFEHLDDPRKTIDEILLAAAPRSLVALDLEDKGAVEYQHISPELSALKSRVIDGGFHQLKTTGNVTVFERNA